MIATIPTADATGEPARSVVIPALNEEEGLAQIIARIEAMRPALAAAGVGDLQIIVVDDGSTDRTG
jgi:glycosyltransferase involved in cell wall biosynthesis